MSNNCKRCKNGELVYNISWSVVICGIIVILNIVVLFLMLLFYYYVCLCFYVRKKNLKSIVSDFLFIFLKINICLNKASIGLAVVICCQLRWTHNLLLLLLSRRCGVGLPSFSSLRHQELHQQRDLRRKPAERAAGAQLPREVQRSVQIQTGNHQTDYLTDFFQWVCVVVVVWLSLLCSCAVRWLEEENGATHRRLEVSLYSYVCE